MKKLLFAVLTITACVVMTGCGKSDRDRYMEAMSQVLTDADEIAKETKYFDELPSAEEKCKVADQAEYFALLKRTTGGAMSMRDIKRTVSKTFDGMTAAQRKDFLKKCRNEKR